MLITVIATLFLSVATAFRYDNQVILMMEDSKPVRQQAESLYNKHSDMSTMLLWNHELLKGFQYIDGLHYEINRGTRIYVVAHGSGTELGTCNAHKIGNILTYLIGIAKNVGRISLDSTAAPFEASFASQLLMHLNNNGITTEVSATIAPVAVTSTGQRVTQHGTTWVHRAKNTKIVANIENKIVVINDDEEYEEDEMIEETDNLETSFSSESLLYISSKFTDHV